MFLNTQKWLQQPPLCKVYKILLVQVSWMGHDNKQKKLHQGLSDSHYQPNAEQQRSLCYQLYGPDNLLHRSSQIYKHTLWWSHQAVCLSPVQVGLDEWHMKRSPECLVQLHRYNFIQCITFETQMKIKDVIIRRVIHRLWGRFFQTRRQQTFGLTVLSQSYLCESKPQDTASLVHIRLAFWFKHRIKLRLKRRGTKL